MTIFIASRMGRMQLVERSRKGHSTLTATFQKLSHCQILLKNQLYGRICVVQRMMLDAVKTAQRQFPTKVYYKEEAAALIKIGDKGCLIYVLRL